MGGNGSYDKKMGEVPKGKRTHIETGYTIMGHKVLLQGENTTQTKNIMNSNSGDPIYLMAKTTLDGSLQILNINHFSDHKIGFEVNLKYDSNGNVRQYNGKESNSHAHEWYQAPEGNMHRKEVEGNTHLQIPSRYSALIKQIENFNKEKHKSKK